MAAYTTVVTHATGDVFPASDWNLDVRDNFAFLHDQGGDIASAATLVGITSQFHRVTGTTTITAITAPSGTGQGGNRLLLKFQSAGCQITPGAAIVLTGGPFVSSVGGTIEFVWDATLAGWVEIGRVNTGVLVYQEFTSGWSSGVAIAETAAATVVTAPAFTFDGVTPVTIEFYAPTFSHQNTACGVNLWDSTAPADMGRMFYDAAASGTISDLFLLLRRRFTPPAASKSYSVRAWCGGNGGLIGVGAGGVGTTMPGYIKIMRDN